LVSKWKKLKKGFSGYKREKKSVRDTVASLKIDRLSREKF